MSTIEVNIRHENTIPRTGLARPSNVGCLHKVLVERARQFGNRRAYTFKSTLR